MLPHLIGIQIFNILPKYSWYAIRHLEDFHLASVFCPTRFRGTYSYGYRLAHAIEEILFRGSGPLHTVRRDGFKSPRHDLTTRFLHVHMNVCVRILPIDTRKRALHIHAPRGVELNPESVMCRHRNRQNQQRNNRGHETGELTEHGNFSSGNRIWECSKLYSLFVKN